KTGSPAAAALGCGLRRGASKEDGVGTQRTLGRLGSAIVAAAICVGATVAVQGASSAHVPPRVTMATCLDKPWVNASYQKGSTPPKLAALVLSCLTLRFPST